MSTWPSANFEDLTINQTDLADTLLVDRSTVRRWQKEGLPYKLGKKREHRFVVPVAINWTVGREIAKEMDLRIREPAILYSLGWITGANKDNSIASVEHLFKEKKKKNLHKHFDYSENQFDCYFAIAFGLFLSSFTTKWHI